MVLTSNEFSSVSESIASVISSLGLKNDIDIASNLLSGIAHATNNFQDPKTSPLAFEMAAILIKQGAKRTHVKKLARQDQETQDISSLFASKKQKTSQNWPPSKLEEQKSAQVRQKLNQAWQTQENQKIDDNPPDDWLAPKIYKGSTAV